MSYFREMEWSGKWDWENIAAFGSKAVESQKKLQLAEWSIVDEGSFNLSGGGGGSGSDDGHGSSSKNSISASAESSIKDGMRWSNTGLITFGGSSGSPNKKMGMMKESEISGSSQQLDASFSCGEPVIGLKLGKRTYFENNGTGSNVKNTCLSAMLPDPSISEQKKTKVSAQNALLSTCQVQGCSVDLSAAKEYHRKHRVCNVHSKCPKVIIGGLERRFCQQCSRFHSLSEFDDKKRSCRNRLSDHNARRRKPHPHQESIQFNSTGISSPFYGVMQQVAFVSNNSPVMYSGAPAKSTWDNTSNPKFTLTNGYLLKSNGDIGIHEQLQMPDMKLPNIISRRGNAANGLLTSKSYPHGILSTGSKGSLISTSHLDAAPEYRRALSLLSSNTNNTWLGGSCEPESIQVAQHHHQNHDSNNNNIIPPEPMMTTTMNAIPEGMPLSSAEYWQATGHHSTLPRFQPFAANGNFQGIQHFKQPYEADFYSNIMN